MVALLGAGEIVKYSYFGALRLLRFGLRNQLRRTNFKYYFSILSIYQDTPGYGDFDGPQDAEAQRNAIIDYVTGCSRKHFDLEVDPARRSSMQASYLKLYCIIFVN